MGGDVVTSNIVCCKRFKSAEDEFKNNMSKIRQGSYHGLLFCCRVKANCLLVETGPVGGATSVVF